MQIKKEMTGLQAYQKLSALCARSEHCQQDMLDKMRQWGVGEDEQAQVMQRLVNEGYINEERYVRAFVNDKIRYNKWGRRKIEQTLRLKHIDKDICRQVLDEVDDDEYLSILKPLLKQKQRSLSQKASSKQGRWKEASLVKYALSRGFTMDIIKQCIEVEDEDEFLD